MPLPPQSIEGCYDCMMPSAAHGNPSINPTLEAPRVYLCQVGDTISCGACCGLYNLPGLSRDSLTAMLRHRTEAFSKIPRTVDDIDGFAEGFKGFTPPKRPFPDFHHCPFVGFIDGGRRVGCLLHPLTEGNAGIDWRGLSYYGGLACASYFCPSSRRIPPEYLSIVKSAFDHWYDYGLMVTERRLIVAVLEAVENRMGTSLADADPPAIAAAATLIKDLSAIHAQWPFRRPDAPGPLNYFFENGEYERPLVRRQYNSLRASRYETIFRELESGFVSDAHEKLAEQLLDGLFQRITPIHGGDHDIG